MSWIGLRSEAIKSARTRRVGKGNSSNYFSPFRSKLGLSITRPCPSPKLAISSQRFAASLALPHDA